LFYFDGEMASAACVLRATTKKKGRQLEKKVHQGDMAGEFSDLEMILLLYCTGAATASDVQHASMCLMENYTRFSICLFD